MLQTLVLSETVNILKNVYLVIWKRQEPGERGKQMHGKEWILNKEVLSRASHHY